MSRSGVEEAGCFFFSETFFWLRVFMDSSADESGYEYATGGVLSWKSAARLSVTAKHSITTGLTSPSGCQTSLNWLVVEIPT